MYFNGYEVGKGVLFLFSAMQKFVFALVIGNVFQFVMNADYFCFISSLSQLPPNYSAIDIKPGKPNIDVALAAIWKIIMVVASGLKFEPPFFWATEIQIWHVIKLIKMLNKSCFWLF